MNIHEKYISRCIELGKLGIGNTYPNPSVGCCIVLDDKIIGEGYTSKAGGNHAEINAINSVEDKSLLKLSTIYVTLEPCCHHGKTPPCVDKIISSGMKKVVIGIKDPNPLVCGKGIEKLKENGIEVSSLEHSPIIGWAYDGNPIYGPFGYTSSEYIQSGIKRLETGYVLRTSSVVDRPSFEPGFFVEDHQYDNLVHQNELESLKRKGKPF